MSNRHEFTKPICSIGGCDKPPFRRGYCAMHYSRLIRRGSVDDSSRLKAANGEPLEWLRAHVEHQEEGCLTYPFAKGREGKVTLNGERRSVASAMCELAHGPKPTPDREAAHNCGKGHEGCAHPQHLRWATHAENLADRVIHGTSNRGERHGMSRFTAEQILCIRAALGRGESQTSIAEKFGTHQGTIGKIAHGERWGWLNG